MKRNGYYSGREWATKQFRAGRASDVISPFNIRPGDPVVVAARKSSRERVEILDAQLRNLRELVEEAGGVVVFEHKHKGSGINADWVGALAGKARRAGAIAIVAEATNRLIRNKHFHSVNYPALQATAAELAELAWCANGTKLITYVHPDATPAEVRRFQTKRGQQAKGRCGGRPRVRRPGAVKHRRETSYARVRELHRSGHSLNQISAELGISRSTIWDWIHRLE